MSVKTVWAGLKQSTRVPCTADCAPQQKRSRPSTGSGSIYSTRGRRLLSVHEVHCCCSQFCKLSRYLSAGASIKYTGHCIVPTRTLLFQVATQSAGREVACLFLGTRKRRTLKSSWIADTAVRSRLRSRGETRPGAVSAEGKSKTQRRQDESQESFDFQPLHYLWDSFERWAWDEWCGACVSACLCVIMCVCARVSGQQQSGVMEGQHTRSYAGRGSGSGFSVWCTFIVPARVCACDECARVCVRWMCVMWHTARDVRACPVTLGISWIIRFRFAGLSVQDTNRTCPWSGLETHIRTSLSLATMVSGYSAEKTHLIIWPAPRLCLTRSTWMSQRLWKHFTHRAVLVPLMTVAGWDGTHTHNEHVFFLSFVLLTRVSRAQVWWPWMVRTGHSTMSCDIETQLLSITSKGVVSVTVVQVGSEWRSWI